MLTRLEADRLLGKLQHGRSRFSKRYQSDNLQDLDWRLHHAADWCHRYGDPSAPGRSLRPGDLRPPTLPSDRWSTVDFVMSNRERAGDLVRVASPRGRLMVYYPDADLCDGAAPVSSQGFFDQNNAPPWGTWVGYFDDATEDLSYGTYLLAWVPESFVTLAAAGMRVNPEECIKWLNEADVKLRAVLAHSAFVGAIYLPRHGDSRHPE